MTIVQYILVRGDLLLREGWPVGAVLAQACHAATAAIHLFYRQWSSPTIILPLSDWVLSTFLYILSFQLVMIELV